MCVCVGAARAQVGEQPDSSPPKRIELSGAVDVAIALIANLPIVETRINGAGPFKMGIETGANFVVISPAVASKLALTQTGGTDRNPAYHVDSIAIGGATFFDLPVSAGRLAQGGIDGVLGLPFYRDLLLTIDYPHQRLRLERGDLPVPDGLTVLALGHAGPFWTLPMTIGGRAVHAVVDTRSMGAFGLTPESAAGLAFDGGLRVVGRARGAAIPETEVKAGRIAGDITVGRYVFPSPMVAVRPLPPGFPTEPLIGARVLSQFVVTLDQRNGRLRLQRESTAPIVFDETAAAPPGAPDYVGSYGTRSVQLADGTLTFAREGGPPLKMVPTGKDTFTLELAPLAKIEFIRDASGAVVALRVLNSEGQWETLHRSGGG
jgi:Aspartyl protease